MTGVLEPTSGRTFLREHEIQPSEYSVRMAHDLPIETVYQDKSLAEKQPLWRNFFVRRQTTNRFGFIDIKRQKEVTQRILNRRDRLPRSRRHCGFDGRQSVGERASGHRDRRAMHCKADLIVPDKPTAALIGAVDAELHTIILHCLLSFEYF